MLEERVKTAIRDVHDFPKEGIVFKDITPVLEDAALSNDVVEFFADHYASQNIDAVIGVESRGFLFGMSIAMKLGVPFITVRKKGKLPYKTIEYSYDLEYGSATIEVHVDSIKPGMNVLIHDDLLATGGTAGAAAELVLKENGTVAGFAFLVGLSFLNGEEKLAAYSQNILNLVTY